MRNVCYIMTNGFAMEEDIDAGSGPLFSAPFGRPLVLSVSDTTIP